MTAYPERCDRCDRRLPQVMDGPQTYTHFRDTIGIISFVLCRYCTGTMKLFIAGARLEGEHVDLHA